MDVRCRYHRFAQCNGVAEGARCALLQILVRRQINLALVEFDKQLIDIEKPVDPFDLIFKPEFDHHFFQAFTVLLAFSRDKVRMCRTDYPVTKIRKPQLHFR